jgi:hypothetical protein
MKHNTVVCVATSEKTWKKLPIYCFNDSFLSIREEFDLAIGFNGDSIDARPYIEGIRPDYFFERPNDGFDLASLDHMIKHIPRYDYYVFLHDDHWFRDNNWLRIIHDLFTKHGAIDVIGNIRKNDYDAGTHEKFWAYLSQAGYGKYCHLQFDSFVQGLAGAYRGNVIERILELGGIPWREGNNKTAAEYNERFFSLMLLHEQFTLTQIPPGYESYLMHYDHREIREKAIEIRHLLFDDHMSAAEDMVRELQKRKPDDPIVIECLLIVLLKKGNYIEARDIAFAAKEKFSYHLPFKEIYTTCCEELAAVNDEESKGDQPN